MSIYLGSTKVSGKMGVAFEDKLPEKFEFSGDLSYAFAYDRWNWAFENYADKIELSSVTKAANLFYQSSLESINFSIPFTTAINYDANNAYQAFEYCFNLCTPPTFINFLPSNLGSMFCSCKNLVFPEDYGSDWDFSYFSSATSGSHRRMFKGCYSIRKIPYNLIKTGRATSEAGDSYFDWGFHSCVCLDELLELPLYYTLAWSSNVFSNTCCSCYRLKNFTFAVQEDNTSHIMRWKNQTLDLSSYVGYAAYKDFILNYNSGITADKEVTDDVSYQALKDDPDWFTCDVAYSRYNHDSAVATINSLPDTSAYLAEAGGTNTIKFLGASGSATDGGAINTLTEEEIAVAAAKGWTVTLV